MTRFTCLSCGGETALCSCYTKRGVTHRTYVCVACEARFRTASPNDGGRSPESIAREIARKIEWPHPDRTWAKLGLREDAFQ